MPKGLDDKVIITKLSYEWKNIYRSLAIIDEDETNLVELEKFDLACQKQNVFLNSEDLRKLMKLFGSEKNDTEMINYKMLSFALGLHKDSFNYLH